VVDVTSPQAAEQTAHVFKVLGEIGAQETAQILVLNKVDLLPDGEMDVDAVAQRVLSESGHHGPTRPAAVSARIGAGMEGLLKAIDESLLLDPVCLARFRFPAGEGGPLNLLHERARVLSSEYTNEYCEVEAEVPESVRRRLREYIVS
jgi:GTPase